MEEDEFPEDDLPLEDEDEDQFLDELDLDD